MSKEGSPVREYAATAGGGQFAASYALFDGLVGWLGGDQSAGLTHAQVDERIHSEGIPVLRQLMQDHFDLQAGREQQLEEVIDADGQLRGGGRRRGGAGGGGSGGGAWTAGTGSGGGRVGVRPCYPVEPRFAMCQCY